MTRTDLIAAAVIAAAIDDDGDESSIPFVPGPRRPAPAGGRYRTVVHTKCSCGAELVAVVGSAVKCPRCGEKVER